MVSVKQASVVCAMIAAGVTASVLGGTTAARAQGLDAPSSARSEQPFRLKIGGYLPTNGNARDTLGINWIAFGAGYDLPKKNALKPSTYEIYFDYFDRTKNTGSGNLALRSEAQLFAIGVADRYYIMPASSEFQPYFGAGAGIYRVRAKTNFVGGQGEQHKTSIGAKFFTGAQIAGGLFGEVEYNVLPEPKLNGRRVRLSGYQLRLGYRF